MGRAIEREAETQDYFSNNWTDTQIQILDSSPAFDNTGLTQYIKLEYLNEASEYGGFNRQTGFGYLQVSCYHKSRKLSISLSDKVKTFFDCKDLDLDIHSKLGQQYPTINLENGYFLTMVQFRIEQES